MVAQMKQWWRNRDVILVSAVASGLVLGRGAPWTQPLVLPALAVVMTLSTMGIRSEMLRSPRELWRPALFGLLLNFLVLGGILLALSTLLVRESAMNDGFVLLVAVPPAIAVIPFTEFLHGNTTFSLLATMACYLGALIITPLIALGFLGTTFIEPGTLIKVIIELIAAPLLISRLLLKFSLAARLEPIKGTITNWSFFVVMYTIVGMNRELFLQRPLSLAPVVVIALFSTFLLGMVIARVGRSLGIDRATLTSLVLLGTLKNYGIAGGLALALFSKKTAIPAAVSSIFMIVYIIWLDFEKRRLAKEP
jgi:BASS family bile acid:Na+ symporter